MYCCHSITYITNTVEMATLHKAENNTSISTETEIRIIPTSTGLLPDVFVGADRNM